jgi:regulatory protein YycH of two-component signal transduction system YycFG
MIMIYIDVPDGIVTGYQYDWELHKNCAEALRMQEGINASVRFICNRGGGISKGDVYELTFNTPEDLTLYLLKNKFEIIADDLVIRYKLTH